MAPTYAVPGLFEYKLITGVLYIETIEAKCGVVFRLRSCRENN